jgi:hypothetical protein
MLDKSLGVFLIFGCFGLANVFRFNLITYRLTSEIKRVAELESKVWDFRRDISLRLTFLFSPESLIESSDTGELLRSKQALVAHRQTLLRCFATSAVLMSLGGLLTALAAFWDAG